MTLTSPRPLDPVDWAPPHEDPLTQLERQIVRGSHFTQAVFDKLVGRLSNQEHYLTELVKLLRVKGILTDEDVGASADDEDEGDEDGEARDDDGPTEAGASQDPARAEVVPSVQATAAVPDPAPEAPAADAPAADAPAVDGRAGEPEEEPEEEEEEDDDATIDSEATGRATWPGIAIRVDPDEAPDRVVEVNCAERMAVCHAVCCKLNFALTSSEVEAGRVKFDLGFPYIIRHESNGYCTHCDTTTGGCSVYDDRPGVCRRYSCANDPRIWKDYEGMVLNEDWIRRRLSDQTRIILRTSLPVMDVAAARADEEAGRRMAYDTA